MAPELGITTQMMMADPLFADIMWKMTPASLAMRLSQGRWQAWPYLQLLSRKLVDVAMGRCKRLIVVVPPRHGKSEMVSHWMPVWYLENFPRNRVILCSYEADFAAKWGGKARDTVATNQEHLTLRFKTNKPAMHHWDTAEGGAMMTAGVGGPITGKGANLFIIDDFVKNPCSNKTPVLMADGSSRLLGELVVGDKVVTHRGRVRRVLELHERGDSECVTIRTFSGREVVAELSHPFLTLFGWKKAEELCVDDRLCMPKEYDLQTTTDRVVEDFRLAGYITGDGCCNNQVAMLAIDQEERDDFELCVKALGLRSTRPGKSRDAGSLHVSGGIAWAKDAQMHGKLAHTKEVPPWVFTASNEHIANFLGAYFATDGYVTSSEAYVKGLVRRKTGGKLSNGCIIRFDSVSKKLLEGVRELLIRLGIYSKLSSSRVRYNGAWRYFWTVYVVGRESAIKFAELIPVHHSEKRPRLDGWRTYHLSRPSSTSVEILKYLDGGHETRFSPNVVRNLRKGYSSGENLSPIGDEYVYDRVVSIEPTRAECRCISVEEDHSFLANGLIAHNSEEAGSLTMREKLWDWWLSTARTRLEPDAGVVVMATRWHSDDLIGRIISPDFQSEKGTKEDWEVFCFPMLAEPDAENYYRQFGVKVNDLRSDSVISKHKHLNKKELDGWRDMLGRRHGQALCPDRYDELDAARIRGGCMEKVWFALYQQRPGDESADGNVYSSFDEMKHLRPLRRDDRMQLFVSMDFNVDPMSVVIGQYELGTGAGYTQRLEVLEELSLLDSNTPNMMMVLIPRLLEYQRGYTLSVQVFGDAAGTQRGTQSVKTNWQIVADHFALYPSIHYKFLRRKTNPLIRDRVNAVNTMLMAADGTIRMYVDEQRCPELVLDFKKVRWDEDSSGNKSGQLDKSDKKRTHISDALGYAVEYLFSLKTKAGGKKGMMQ